MRNDVSFLHETRGNFLLCFFVEKVEKAVGWKNRAVVGTV